MSLLKTIKKGPEKRPHFMIIYGVDGVGKSTIASGAPSPIFIGSENLHTLDVSKFPKPETFSDVLSQMTTLIKEEHEYKTLVIDSLDWIEPLIFKSLCDEYRAKTIEEVDGGYGKGYTYSLAVWRRLLQGIDLLREKGMNVVLIGHAFIKAFNDPDANETYDRYIIKLNEKAASVLREATDEVLFINYETNTFKEKKGKTKATGDGSRVIYTERRPAFDAKNRHSLPFEIEIPVTTKNSPTPWENLMNAFPKN